MVIMEWGCGGAVMKVAARYRGGQPGTWRNAALKVQCVCAAR